MTVSGLKLALVQMPVATLAVEDNLARGAELIARAAAEGANLVVLPELWTTGFHWPKNVQMAAEHVGIHERVAALAVKHGVWLAGSLLSVGVKGGAANTSMLFSPEGACVAQYSKMHLFSLTGEDRYLEPGAEAVCAELPWGQAGLTICYDLRFPELWRMLALAGARLILCPAGFPEPRQEHWRTLLRARAIENQCFVAGVNQTGTQTIAGGSPLTYFGGSLLVDPWGEVIWEGGRDEALHVAEIDLGKSDEVRRRMTVFQDRRPECYRLG